MTRQEAYVAELNQLLFYMTPWDKAEVLKGITAMINHPETGVKTMEEMGSPMKLAVTLHRQYTPTPDMKPPLDRTVTHAEYDSLVDYALKLGVKNCFIQEGGTQSESFIPPFDLTGI